MVIMLSKYCGNLVCDGESSLRSPMLCGWGSSNHSDKDFFVKDGHNVVNLGDDSNEKLQGIGFSSVNKLASDEHAQDVFGMDPADDGYSQRKIDGTVR